MRLLVWSVLWRMAWANSCYPDTCMPDASILDAGGASTVVIGTSAFEAAGLSLSVTTWSLKEAQFQYLGDLYALFGFWQDKEPCPFLAAVPLSVTGTEGCCGMWCDPSGEPCGGSFGRRVAVSAAACEDSESWHKKATPSKDCAWVASYAEQRCSVVGDDESLGSEGCPAACGSCEAASLVVELEASCFDDRVDPIVVGLATAAPTRGADASVRADESSCATAVDAYGNCVDEGCTAWYDGCNRCRARDGFLACTEMYCASPGAAYCADATDAPVAAASCSTVVDAYGNCVDAGCASWYDGCNRCMVMDGGLACTRMYCAEPLAASCADETSAPTADDDRSPESYAVSGSVVLLGVDIETVETHAGVVVAAVAAVSGVAEEAVEISFSSRGRRRRLEDGVVVSFSIVGVESEDAAERISVLLSEATSDEWTLALAAAAAESGVESDFASASVSTTRTSVSAVLDDDASWSAWTNGTSGAAAVALIGLRSPLLASAAAGVFLGARAEEASEASEAAEEADDTCDACEVSLGTVHVVLVHSPKVVASWNGSAIACADAETGEPAPCTGDYGADCRRPTAWGSGCVYGRPFEGGRVAATRWGSDGQSSQGAGRWLDPDVWAARGAAEHASVASFAQYALRLAAAGAPLDLLGDTSRGMADEVGHARDAYDLAGRLRGTTAAPRALDVDAGAASDANAASDRASPAARLVVDTWDAGCVAETLAAARAVSDLDEAAASIPGNHPLRGDVLGALARVADDERRHAALAWRALRWAATSDEAANATLADRVALLRAPTSLERLVVLPAARSVLADASPPAFEGVAPALAPLAAEIRAALLPVP